jgi:hypothetical protein
MQTRSFWRVIMKLTHCILLQVNVLWWINPAESRDQSQELINLQSAVKVGKYLDQPQMSAAQDGPLNNFVSQA